MPNPPVVLRCVAGRSRDFARSTPNDDGSYGGMFTGSETITATVWPEGQEAASLRVAGSPNAWIAASTTTWLVSFTDAQTGTLAPGVYEMEVTAPISGRTGVLFRGQLEVAASAGSAVPANLASAYYVGKALSQINLAPDEWEFLPDNLAAASALIRLYCRRQFTQATYVETVPVIDGIIRLREIPVNQVTRCQGRRQRALWAQNTSATSSWVSQTQTGDVYAGLTITGLTLNAISNGVLTQTAITYTANETIAAVAAAITAAGNGWSATADSVLGALPITELIDGAEAKGAGPNDYPYTGAEFHVFGSNLTGYRPLADDGQKTGMYHVGHLAGGGLDGAWGFWDAMDGDGPGRGLDRVKATYVGGFAAIPYPIQMAVAELVKAIYERLKTDHQLKSEDDGNYRYELAVELVGNLPLAVRRTIDQYRVPNA